MSWLSTSLCRTLGIEVPLVQAPIGSAASPELVAAVCNAGGLVMLAFTWTPAERILAGLRRVRELTDRPFGSTSCWPSRSATSSPCAWSRVCR